MLSKINQSGRGLKINQDNCLNLSPHPGSQSASRAKGHGTPRSLHDIALALKPKRVRAFGPALSMQLFALLIPAKLAGGAIFGSFILSMRTRVECDLSDLKRKALPLAPAINHLISGPRFGLHLPRQQWLASSGRKMPGSDADHAAQDNVASSRSFCLGGARIRDKANLLNRLQRRQTLSLTFTLPAP